MRFVRRNIRLIGAILLVVLGILFFLGYTITQEKEVKKLIEMPIATKQ